MKKTTTQTSLTNPTPAFGRGFTLLELLVSITIIIVLAAVVFVVTGKIKAKAQQANAMSSLRQVAAFNMAYSTENNGDINTMRWGGDPKEGGGNKWVSNTFWGRLQPYLFPDLTETNQKKLAAEIEQRLDQLFNTSDSDTMAGTVISGARIYHDTSGLPVPIAFNTNLHKWGTFLKVSSFGDPSLVLYATYGFGFFTKAHGQAYTPMPRDNSMPENKIYYLDNRQALAAFLDGRVDMISPPMPDRNFE